VCAARSADLVKETTELVTKAGGKAIAVVCDLGEKRRFERWSPTA
jgi:hypothetical protein